MRTSEAAKYTGFSERTLLRWRNEGLATHRPRGGAVLYHKDDLDRFINKHREGGKR
jgi:excisionase family DNA binding protein